MDEKDEVKRYDLADADQLELTPAQDGDYVKYSDYAALAERMKEAEVTVGWFCDLVKRASIGTAETPSLRAYVEQLEERLKMCETERDRTYVTLKDVTSECERLRVEVNGFRNDFRNLSIPEAVAERDTLKAENTRLRELLNEILEHDGSRAAFHAFKLYEARRKAEAILMAPAKEQP